METIGSLRRADLQAANREMGWRFGLSAAVLAMTCLTELALASSAHAALINLSLSGSRQASFQLDTASGPDKSQTSTFGDQTQYYNVDGRFGGVEETATIGFGTNLFADLNILADGLGFTQFAGPDLFSGPATMPTFELGVFDLNSIVSGRSTISISAATAAPEPSTWVLLTLGFLGVAFFARQNAARPGLAGVAPFKAT